MGPPLRGKGGKASKRPLRKEDAEHSDGSNGSFRSAMIDFASKRVAATAAGKKRREKMHAKTLQLIEQLATGISRSQDLLQALEAEAWTLGEEME